MPINTEGDHTAGSLRPPCIRFCVWWLLLVRRLELRAQAMKPMPPKVASGCANSATPESVAT